MRLTEQQRRGYEYAREYVRKRNEEWIREWDRELRREAWLRSAGVTSFVILFFICWAAVS